MAKQLIAAFVGTAGELHAECEKVLAKPIPEYDGSLCTSACGNDYDCPHGEQFDEDRGIVRSGLDFDVKCECAKDELMSVDEMLTHLEKTGKVFPFQHGKEN